MTVIHYTSVSQHTSVESIFLGVPPNLKMSKKVRKKSHVLILLVFFSILVLPQFFFKYSVPQAQKGWEPMYYTLSSSVLVI